ncbi:hypothetical protein OAI00_03760 [Euryarchaeota archaeon]|jgi:hypothetical protein|nr:hypothetical protein [Euryarchaeota archaeon]|tara:strand:+ start:19796 stop:20404 length:609 start_codon:yes stop_codon:yes gene_type:complete
MDVHKICDVIKPIFDKYQNEEFVEMEFRLGKFNGSFFDVDVGIQNYNKILQGLKMYSGWEKVISSKMEVYYRDSDNLRISIDENTDETINVKKERIHTENFNNLKNTPYDVRFSVSKEIPLGENFECDGDMDKKKMKERVSFVRKNLSIDVTKCTGGTDDIDEENESTYQIEFEIVVPKNLKNIDELFNIIYKIKDVFKLLE